MTTEAALLLITNKEGGLTEGLDLGIAVLFLNEYGKSLECDNQNAFGHPEIVAVIATLSVIIVTMLISLVVSVVYLR